MGGCEGMDGGMGGTRLLKGNDWPRKAAENAEKEGNEGGATQERFTSSPITPNHMT